MALAAGLAASDYDYKALHDQYRVGLLREGASAASAKRGADVMAASRIFRAGFHMTDEEAAALERHLERSPSDSGARLALMTKLALSDPKRHAHHAMILTERDPSWPLLRPGSAVVSGALPEYEAWKDLWLRQVTGRPRSPAVAGNAAMVLQYHDPKLADALFRRALGLSGDSYWSLEYGMFLQRNGRPCEAAKSYEAALGSSDLRFEWGSMFIETRHAESAAACAKRP